jgi:hypothetical protein
MRTWPVTVKVRATPHVLALVCRELRFLRPSVETPRPADDYELVVEVSADSRAGAQRYVERRLDMWMSTPEPFALATAA